MTSQEFIRSLVVKNERIYIDTCCLMDAALPMFIDQYKDLFVKNNKKIIVPEMVIYELAMHANSYNYKCKSQAMDAKQLLETNKDLFDFCWIDANQYKTLEHTNTHADVWILCNLLQNRSKYDQILITLDRGLQSDAYNQTTSSSVFGKKVNVMAFNQSGTLKMINRDKSLDQRDVMDMVSTLSIRKFFKYKFRLTVQKLKSLQMDLIHA